MKLISDEDLRIGWNEVFGRHLHSVGLVLRCTGSGLSCLLPWQEKGRQTPFVRLRFQRIIHIVGCKFHAQCFQFVEIINDIKPINTLP